MTYIKNSSLNQIERMLERIKRENNRKLAAVRIEITEAVIIKLKKPGESKIIMNIIKELYEERGIKEIVGRIEFNELAECHNINLRIESKKLFLVLQNISAIEKIAK